MDAAFGVREPPERVSRARPRSRREPGTIHERPDRRPVAMDVLGGGEHPHPHRGQAVALGRIDGEVETVDAQPGQAGAHLVERRAGVQQRPQQHVAGDSADRVDVQQSLRAHAAPAAARAIRAAIVAAPNPSSMLTTATPGAHEVNIASSAGMPPAATP